MGAAIRVENVGKRYRVPVGDMRPAYRTLRETVGSAVGDGLRRLRAGAAAERAAAEEFWALTDVSFEVQPGEVVGIIGHNGAGKSTLLKVLSRITKPTTGRVELAGRVGSLLEVGTGFHPELTGRENVYLNGSILGMSRPEVARKFDEIVAFAEVEKFLDTPVKRYSSGMYVRLAFAVAAHLEPEILIVDEVLAVGDISFQQKCLRKMKSASASGRTVLLVTHTMSVLEQLATRSVLLEKGRSVAAGDTKDVIVRYLAATTRADTADRYDLTGRHRQPDARRAVVFEWAALVDRPTRLVPADDPLEFDIGVRADHPCAQFRFSFTLFRRDGSPVGSVFGPHRPAPPVGRTGTFRLRLADHRLAPGDYHLDMATGRGTNADGGYADFDTVHDILHFTVSNPANGDHLASWSPGWGPIRFPTPTVAEC